MNIYKTTHKMYTSSQWLTINLVTISNTEINIK